jgi:hypothetical protein
MSWLFIGSYVRLAPEVDQGRNEPGDSGLRMDEGLTGSHSRPEVPLKGMSSRLGGDCH